MIKAVKNELRILKTQPWSLLLLYLCHGLRIAGMIQWYSIVKIVLDGIKGVEFWAYATMTVVMAMAIPLMIYLFFTFIGLHIIAGFYQTTEFSGKKFREFGWYATKIVGVMWATALIWQYLASGVIEEWALWYYFLTGIPITGVLMMISSEAYARFFMKGERETMNSVICLVEKEAYKTLALPIIVFATMIACFSGLYFIGWGTAASIVAIVGTVKSMIIMDIEFFGRHDNKRQLKKHN